MTDVMLILGCGLLAFGPFLSLFSLIVYKKAQLVIVVTTAAFFFLLATLLASLVWFVLDKIGLGGVLAATIPGVFFQFLFRCVFVSLYHRVEAVIQESLDRQHRKEVREERERAAGAGQGGAAAAAAATPSNNETDTQRSHANGRTNDGNSNLNTSNHSSSNSSSNRDGSRSKTTWSEAARLRLQLNDASCGVAAGVGYGGMHAILLYGTLLASEASHSGGVLYQQSCPGVPSLIVSAIYSFCFTILDVFWMLFTFFGMRRRLIYHRGQHGPHGGVRHLGAWLGDSRNGGNLSLLLCLGTHLLASLVTLAGYFNYGCRVSLPLVGGCVLLTSYLFWAGVGRIYMPPNPTLSQLRSTPRANGGEGGSVGYDSYSTPEALQRRID